MATRSSLDHSWPKGFVSRALASRSSARKASSSLACSRMLLSPSPRPRQDPMMTPLGLRGSGIATGAGTRPTRTTGDCVSRCRTAYRSSTSLAWFEASTSPRGRYSSWGMTLRGWSSRSRSMMKCTCVFRGWTPELQTKLQTHPTMRGRRDDGSTSRPPFASDSIRERSGRESSRRTGTSARCAGSGTRSCSMQRT